MGSSLAIERGAAAARMSADRNGRAAGGCTRRTARGFRSARDCMTAPSITASTSAAVSPGSGTPAARRHASTWPRHAAKLRAMSSCAGVFSGSISSASRPIGQPVLTAGVDEALPVAFEQREDALDGIGRLTPGRTNDVRLEQLDVRVEHRPEQVVLALEEVVEAAAVRLGAHQDVGQPRGRVAALPEEVARGLDDAFPGVAKGGRGGGHVC